jgi:hypothetical protein
MKRPTTHLTLFAVAAVVLLFSGCSRVPTGSVAIQQGTFSGVIADHVALPGLHIAPFTGFTLIDTTQTRAEVKAMQPKDAHGVSLKDVTVVVTYTLDPNRVSAFYRKTKELDREPEGGYNTLGLQILERSIVPYAVQIATENSDLTTISSHLGDYAATIQKTIQARLDALYPGINPFVIQSVTVPTFELPESIQKQVNAKAGYQAELQTIAAEQAVIEQRKQLQQDQAEVAANALEQASKSTGLSPEQIIAWEKARAYATLAGRISGGNVLIEVPKP